MSRWEKGSIKTFRIEAKASLYVSSKCEEVGRVKRAVVMKCQSQKQKRSKSKPVVPGRRRRPRKKTTVASWEGGKCCKLADFHG